jgi:hypothetical protein
MAQPPIPSYLDTNITVNRSQAEQAIYLELEGDSRFPSVSVTRYQYPDRSEAFPENATAPAVSSVEVYPKFATLNYIVNPEDITYGLLAQDGFVVADNTSGQVTGAFSTLQVISACKFSVLSATNSTTNKILSTYELPQNFSITGPITDFRLIYGAVIAYKNN